MTSLTIIICCFTSLQLKWNPWLRSLCCFTSLLLKLNLWLRSLRYFTSLLWTWNLWLRSLRCFISLLVKWYPWLRSLCCFTLLLDYAHYAVYFTIINPRYRTARTKLLISAKYFPRNFSVSIKFLCATVVSPSGISVEPYILYYPNFDSLTINLWRQFPHVDFSRWIG